MNDISPNANMCEHSLVCL